MANLSSKVKFENRKIPEVLIRGGLQGGCQRKVRLQILPRTLLSGQWLEGSCL